MRSVGGPGSARGWLPFGIFVVLTAAALIAAECGGVVLFTSLTPLLLLPVLGWVWWVHLAGRRNLGGVRGQLVALTRLVIVTLLILTLTEPRAVREDRRLAVMFVVDHSASIQAGAGDAAMRYVLKVAAGKPEDDEAGLVFFGKNAGVELPPATTLPFESINVDIDREGTDLGEALSVAAFLLPPDRVGRLVLISDGVATQGELSPVLDDLRARGVAVDVVPVDYEATDEVWLEKLELPRTVKVGETVQPAVVLSSLRPGAGELILEHNGEVVARTRVEYGAGRSRFAVPLRIDVAGYHDFTARIAVDTGPGGAQPDQWRRNNVAMASLYLQGKGRIAIVTDPGGDPRDMTALVAALRRQQRAVDVVPATAVPHDPLALQPYDAIAFVNVPRDAFDERQLQAVHDAVFDQGSGFLMVGGQQSFGPGGYRRTVIEDLLPVTMDMSQRKAMPKGALAIILHTCEFPRGNTWGKRITLQAMKVLDGRDEVGVLVHDYQGGDRWLFDLTPAAEFERLAPMVNRAQIGDMPGFAPTMQLAQVALAASDAATRHVIVISDGDAQPPPPGLLQRYVAAGISVTAVAVFPHGGVTPASTATMRAIASTTKGRFYAPSQPGQLPAIFVKEAKTLRRSGIVNETFHPQVRFSSPVLKGIDALPPLHGFVLVMPKARAQTVLEGPEPEEEDPVLARWRYGVGVAAAFTSDLGANWGRDWVAWERYSAFVQQLFADILRPRRPDRLLMETIHGRGKGTIRVEDRGEGALLALQAVVDGPDGMQVVPLEPIGSRRFEGRFPATAVGRYRVVVSEPGSDVRAHAGFVVPFGEEYRRFRADPVLLSHIAERTGGRVLTGDEGAEEIFDPDRVPARTSRSLVDLLVVVVVMLLPFEVALRRVQVDLLAWRQRRRGPQTTMRGLLARKQEIAASMQPVKTGAGVRERDTASEPTSGRRTRRDQDREAPSRGLSTTERLLAIKNRRKPEDRS